MSVLMPAVLEPDTTLFRRAFEHAPVGMTLASPEGRLLRVNRAYCALTGCSEDELVGRRFQDLTHPDDLGPELVRLQEVLAGLRPSYTFEKRLATKAGGYVWVQRSVTLERTAQGAPEFLLSVLIDISARKAAEEALQKSSTQLTTAQRVARIGSWELDLTTLALRWSDEIFRIFELDPATVPAPYEASAERVHPDDRARVDEAYRRSVTERVAYDFTHRLLMGDGRIKHVRAAGETFYADDGRPLRSLGTVQDVTEQKLAELTLRDHEARLSAILTTTSDAVALFECEPDSIRLTEISPSGLERLRRYLPGVTAETLLGRDFQDMARDLASRLPSLGNLRELLASVLEQGVTRQFEMESTPSPVVTHSEVTLSPVRGEGRCRQVLLVARDVTERKKAERLVRASLSEKETLLSEIHHRVKNNLQIISSMLSLQNVQGGDAGTRELLEAASNRIHTMALVHEQLYRTRNFSSVDLAEHIQSLATMVAQSQVHREGITLQCTLEPVSLSLDQAIPLGLVLNELLSNAWKHAFHGRTAGTISVTCAREGQAVRVQVADDGCGLPGEQTVEGARTLGLRLVRTLLAQLRATLTIERDHGTRIVMLVPLEAPARE